MKIVILNGNPDGIETRFDRYLVELTGILEGSGNKVKHLVLRDMNIRYCTGCFGCWVKTPGECVVKDDSEMVCREMIHADFVIWASPLRMGFPSALLKKMMDKSIPLIHPYFDVDRGEAHHKRRYPHYPRLGLILERETDTDETDLSLVTDIFARTAINMKSKLEFMYLIDEPAERVAKEIQTTVIGHDFSKNALPATTGKQVNPPKKLVLFNGSPRGAKGNTPLMLEQIRKGYLSHGTGDADVFHLVHVNDQQKFLQSFENADCVLLGFPLYTDGMPGIVKTFIESLDRFRGRAGNPAIGFLVQSGFPEPAHSRHVEHYLEKLSNRLGSQYLGAIIKGGGEGIRLVPENANRKLYERLQYLGKGLAERGELDPQALSAIAGREKYPAFMVPIFKLLVKLPVMNFYWNSQLKQNHAYEKRFSQPYL